MSSCGVNGNQTEQQKQQQKLQQEQNKRLKDNMAKIKHKVVVMSGKGGVGKSTVSTNLAYGLALEGKKVGILDADIHGPNIPQMLGVEGKKLASVSDPYHVLDNLKAVSLSFYVRSSDDPIIWRGPKKIGAIKQLLADINWGELDYLVVDLPPGTGDEPLTIGQDLGKIDGSVIVTTPQDVALLDSRKSVKFSKMLNMPILGIVENMSGFVCPSCNERVDIFKKGGGKKAAEEMDLNLLAEIPMEKGIAEGGDSGKPHIYFNENTPASRELNNMTKKVLDLVESGNETDKKGDEDKNMKSIKLAFPTSDENTIDEHFGHCKKFALYTIESGEIIEDELVDAPEHQPGLLPKFLAKAGADVIITGGMGQKAIDIFDDNGIKVILGVNGKILEAVKKYLRGEIESKGSACTHDHH
ncbi:MAG: iron-sulfur cluster carrier protein MrpORP [Fusobacteriota bacterium]